MNRTIEERLAEVVADFAAREPAGAPWLEEPATRRVLAAWKALPARLTVPLTIGGVPMHAHNRWRYAWKFRDMNAATAAVAEAAGVTAPDAAALLDRLAAGRFIYPDGRLTRAAETALNAPPA